LAVAASAVALLAGACNVNKQVQDIAGVPLTNGTAHVEITGDAESTFDAPLEQGRVGSAATVFVYKSESNDLFSITGFGGVEGTAKTSNTLPLVVNGGDIFATSAEGECTITLTRGDDDSENGTASCTNLDSNKGTIDVEATFSATR